MANSIFLSNGLSSDAGGNSTTPGTITAGGAGGSFYAADGTALLPAYSFTSEPTLGFWRSAAGTVKLQGALATTGTIAASGSIFALNAFFLGASSTLISAPSDGNVTIKTNAGTTGSQLKVDALPTIASGFGTSPSITAGSTPLAGSVNVGTGGVATSGLVNFNGTAFPSAPFCVLQSNNSNVVLNQSVTTTQIQIASATAAFPSGCVISWICISSK